MANNVLYPDPLDEAYQISWLPEADLPYPYIYRVYVRDGDTGDIVTPNELNDFWAEYPLADSVEYDDPDREDLLTTIELSARIDIKTLLARNGGKFGLYLVSIHQYDQVQNILAEREQSAYLYVIENGLKPPSFK